MKKSEESAPLKVRNVRLKTPDGGYVNAQLFGEGAEGKRIEDPIGELLKLRDKWAAEDAAKRPVRAGGKARRAA